MRWVDKPSRPMGEVVAQSWLEIEGRDCTITIQSRPPYCDRGNYLAKIFPTGALAREMDEADGWPRYYFDLDYAKRECEAWLIKRKQDVPNAL